ncbi:hypothetical protein BDY24DRAFT_402618 [Mrakia frigida]|uniref:uncharacterized protein n=1 Tax=Mrakia frigida TaxID=29902 RepID=UPI003FCBF87C
MSSDLGNPFLEEEGGVFAVKFKLTLPTPGDESSLVYELKTKFGQDGSFRPEEVDVTVDSFTGLVMTGQAVFQSAMCAERAMAVGVNSGPMVHYVDGEETVECIVELPNREAYDEKPNPEQYLKIQPIDSFIDTTSLFDALRSFGSIMALKTQTLLSKKGRPTAVGAIWFYNSSSCRAAFAALNLKSTSVDPCSLTISRHPNSTQPQWNVLFPNLEDLENKLRTLFPGAIDLRVVDFTGDNPRAMGVARFSTPEAAKENVGDRSLDMLGDSRIELTSITRGDTPLKAVILGLDTPRPAAAAAPVASTSAAPLPSPLAYPGTGSASPQVPYQPSPQPLASTSNIPYNASPLHQTSWNANGNGSGSSSRETSLRAQSKLKESRKEWSSTLKPYPFPKAQLRGTREGEPKSIAGYSICDLPEGDLDRMKDYVLSYAGSDWPDFSAGTLTKADIQNSRKARWEAEGDRWKTAITAVRLEEVKQLESSFAKTDLPKAGEQLTERERNAMESSLVELELGQVRKWHNDDALLKQLRLRELNTINPPTTSSSSTSSSQTPALFPHALLGVIKTTRPSSSHLSTFNNAPSSSSASSSDLELDLPSRYPPPRFNFTPPPPDQSALRKDWKDGYPPAPKSFKEFKDGTWDDGYGGRLREEIWDFLKATNSDAGGQKAQDYKTKFDAIGYLDTFFRWHEEVSFLSSFLLFFSSVGTGEGKEGGR